MTGEVEKKSSLLDLVSDYNRISQELMIKGGELTPELDRFFAEVSTNISKKADGYYHILERLESDANFWKSQAAECANARKISENFRDRLKETMKMAMQMMELEIVQGDAVRFTLANAAPTYELLDLDAIPAEFIEEKVTVTKIPVRDKIMAALKDGAQIPGVRMLAVKTLRATRKRGSL